ncbi:MAG: HD domain-containing protein [Nitrosopumilus sp. H13]|nr:MAG: HD domain-containing protein [Nitrosopumilus sp. H13]
MYHDYCLMIILQDRGKKFRDPVHGFIHMTEAELEIINSPVFQRTRNIKQLSLGHYVYHGAEHSRFGHMIGAAHIAGLAYDSLKKNSKSEKIDLDDRDRATLRIAALLHDVGHTPFSHSLETILDKPHEDYSQKLVESYFEDMIKKADVDVDDVNSLIKGVYSKPFLNNIVSGQLDVDRLDYLLRDTYYSGVTYGRYDLGRIIEEMAIRHDKFVVLQGGYEAVEQLIFARYQMYQQVYFHKTKRSFELMLWMCAKILKEQKALDYPSLDDLENDSGISKYIQRDDRWFLNEIFGSKDPRVVIIADMIKKRKPYWEIYSPVSYRSEPSNIRTEPDNSTNSLGVIQNAFFLATSDLGIEEHEFLKDDISRSPYKLMPDYAISDIDETEGTSISIYYENRDFVEPIEKRSHIVYTLAKNPPSMIRGFVIPKKYPLVREHFRKTFDYCLPERS